MDAGVQGRINQPSAQLQPLSHSMPGPSAPTGCSITEAVTILGNKLRDHRGQLNTSHLLAQCDYFHNTFIRHYKLYQYVLGQDQDVNLTVTHLEVCVPPQPLPLVAGKDQAVWKHRQQVVGLSAAEVQTRAYALQLKEALQLQQQHLLQEMLPELPGGQRQALKREVRWGPRGGRRLACPPPASLPTKRTPGLDPEVRKRSTHPGGGRRRQALRARFMKHP